MKLGIVCQPPQNIWPKADPTIALVSCRTICGPKPQNNHIMVKHKGDKTHDNL